MQFVRLPMFQRIVGMIVTVVGVVLALIVGFWALLLLALFALVAFSIYLVRGRTRTGRRRPAEDVIEGEYEVMNDNDRSGRKRHEDEQPPR